MLRLFLHPGLTTPGGHYHWLIFYYLRWSPEFGIRHLFLIYSKNKQALNLLHYNLLYNLFVLKFKNKPRTNTGPDYIWRLLCVRELTRTDIYNTGRLFRASIIAKQKSPSTKREWRKQAQSKRNLNNRKKGEIIIKKIKIQ